MTRRAILNSREVATKVNEAATRADRVEAYNTDLYVRIPGIGMRPVRFVRLDGDAFVVLELYWMKGDAGKAVTK